MWLAGFGACSSEPPDQLGDGTFGGMYAAQITNDCRQYVTCQDLLEMPVRTGWYDNCVNQTAKLLNDNTGQQPGFLTKVTRCGLRMSCEYTQCVQNSPVTSYGMTQIDKLNYLCQAKTQCQIDMGTFGGDPAIATANCAGGYVGTLDNWSPDQRREFEQTYGMCATLVSCQFLGCFPF